jgi:alkylation response protein AidB-like acyl-CoA dehydrogenase
MATKTRRPPTPQAQTSEPPVAGAMPDTRDINFYDADPHLRFLLRMKLSADELARGEPLLRSLGARLGNEIEDLASAADRNTPTLQVRDKRGNPVNDVDPSPAYREMERIFYGEYGLAAMSLRSGVHGWSSPATLVLNDALIYLAEQTESGLFCPLSMTRALTRTLNKFASQEIIKRYIPGLTATDLDRLLTGAMFMTERQSGSDLGIITTTARQAPGSDEWRLYGDKWFCSNAGADLILTLARPEGAPTGTRGLGLFLVPKRLPDGSRNAYRIERLKDKLGIRSFASAEVTFDGAVARMIGGPGVGWLQMTEMLNVTRLGCASAAAALARRSFLEALIHARCRVAFGRRLTDLPLMREQLLDMLLDVEAMTSLFFEGSAQLAAADAGDGTAATVARILIPLAKFHVSDQARRVVEQGMEVRGGNGYIEEWPNARLLRDVEVQAIWEGTGNISALDVGRAILREHAGSAVLAELSERLRAVTVTSVRRAAHLTQRALDQAQDVIDGLQVKSADERDLVMRRLTQQLAHVVASALLVEQADIQAREENNYRLLTQAARYLRRHLYLPAGGPAADGDRLALDWFNEIVDYAPAMPASAAEPLLVAMECGA